MISSGIQEHSEYNKQTPKKSLSKALKVQDLCEYLIGTCISVKKVFSSFDKN